MRRVALATLALLGVLAPAASADRAYDILPPGQYGGLPLEPSSTNQLPLYDALTPKRGRITAGDLRRLFKPEVLRPIGPTTLERTPRRGLTIRLDRWEVPHIYGRTRRDVWYGVGWVAGRVRSLLMLQASGAAYAAVADVPGLNAFGLVTAGRTFRPSAQARALVHQQRRRLVRAYGAKGREMLGDLAAYAAGVTAGFRAAGVRAPRWTVDDTIAVNAFIGSIFGNGGGAEAENASFLADLRSRLGARRAAGVFEDVMAANDPEAPTTIRRRFPFGPSSGFPTKGSPLVDQGSLERAADPTRASLASNFLVVGGSRSRSRSSLFVAGPQLNYYYPQIVFEADLHGPGLRAQGAFVPGAMPYMLLGRTRDYAWSLTTAQNDNTDSFLERLCGGDRRHYVHRGRCVPMRRFDAGVLGAGGGAPARRLVYDVSVHGPVVGYARVRGGPYAVTRARATYGRDGLSLAANRDMTLGRGRTVPGFFRSANQFGFTFNWAYVSRRHTAYFSSGRIPHGERGLNELLPRLGTGPYDWKGFVPLARHPHAVDPPGGLLLNWNNKPAPRWMAGDDVHSYGSVHRVELFRPFSRRQRLEGVVSVMNRAATQDLRTVELWPVIRAVLRTGPAPDALTRRAAALVDAWRARGSARLDRNGDGRIDWPGAAVMDAAFVPMARAVMAPVLGASTNELAALEPVDSPPYREGGNGSSFGGGWYGYVDKDLRRLLGRPVRGAFSTRYCGRGSLPRCRAALWGALGAAARRLAATQGPDPSRWRASASADRIEFLPRLIPNTMRWTNRPTFQQVLELDPPPRPRRPPRPRFTG